NPLPDLTGSWYGAKEEHKQSFLEFFDLTSSEQSVNLYTLTGTGPAYDTQGVCMRSGQQKIAFAILESVGTNTTLRATYGPFGKSSKSTSANTKGIIEPITPIKFNAVMMPDSN